MTGGMCEIIVNREKTALEVYCFILLFLTRISISITRHVIKVSAQPNLTMVNTDRYLWGEWLDVVLDSLDEETLDELFND